MIIEIEYWCFKITHYYHGRPAPACSNPSSPAYSDCEDYPELEAEVYLYFEGKEYHITGKLSEAVFNKYYSKILDEIIDLQESERDQAMIDMQS